MMLDQVCVEKYWHGSSVGIKQNERKLCWLLVKRDGDAVFAFKNIEIICSSKTTDHYFFD